MMWLTRAALARSARTPGTRSLFVLPSKKYDVAFVAADALPLPKHVPIDPSFQIGYVDVGPAQAQPRNANKTIVFLHGAAGTHQDFRYMIPHLQQDFRVVAIDLPGCGSSTPDNSDDIFRYVKPLELAQATLDALQQICRQDEKIFLVGHSLGAHAVLNVASLNQDRRDSNVKINGLGFIAPAGSRPHRAMPGHKSMLNVVCGAIRSENPMISTSVKKVNSFVYKRLLGFRDAVSDHELAIATLLAGATDFSIVANAIRRNASIPAFVAYSLDDPLLEIEVPQELGELCHDGPRIAFDEGGHNLQKTKATEIAHHLTKWISSFD